MQCAGPGVIAIAAAVLIGGGAARAETPPKPRGAGAPVFAPAAAVNARRLSEEQREERRFLKEAAASGRFEAEASRLALAKSSHAGVRSFAATLVNHQTSVGNELVHMLHVRGMAPPMLANSQRKTLNRLAKLHGGKFDREYVEEIGLKTLQEDVQLFEKARHATRDPQLKAWVERMLPTLRYHLVMAERLAPASAKSPRGAPAANAEPVFDTREAVVQTLTAEPFVARASLSTRAMGAAPAPLGLTRPASPASASSSR